MNPIIKALLIVFFAFQLEAGQAQELKVKLPSKAIEIQNCDFIISESIDARKNKMMLGTVKRGLKHRSRIASLHKGLNYQFNRFINKSFTDVVNYDYEILLVVRQLSIAESSLRFNEAARVTATYDFYLPADGKYKKVHRSQQFLKNTSGLDVTSSHDRLIVETIVNAIHEFHQADWRGEIDQIDGVVYKEMIKPWSFEYPILSVTQPKKGIYVNIDQFRNNNPAFTNFKAKINPDKNTAKPEKSSGLIVVYDNDGTPRKITWRIWGFCTGDQFFIRNSNGDFTQLVRKGDHFFFQDFIRLSENPDNKVIGGLIGEHRDYVIFKLDINSGEFIFVGR